MTEIGKGKKILVVDDEPDVCAYLARLFEESGYTVTTATNGSEASQAVEKGRPDLITLDLSMPNTSGVKFYREFKSHPAYQGIPVVFVTAVTGMGGDPRDAVRFYSTRHQVPAPDGFVPKPIDPNEITRLVNRLVGVPES